MNASPNSTLFFGSAEASVNALYAASSSALTGATGAALSSVKSCTLSLGLSGCCCAGGFCCCDCALCANAPPPNPSRIATNVLLILALPFPVIAFSPVCPSGMGRQCVFHSSVTKNRRRLRPRHRLLIRHVRQTSLRRLPRLIRASLHIQRRLELRFRVLLFTVAVVNPPKINVRPR